MFQFEFLNFINLEFSNETLYYKKTIGLSPILLLSRVDEVNRYVRMKPIGKYDDLEQLKQKAASIFNIQECRIFYNVNYVSEDKRDFKIDQSTYKILEEVVSIATQIHN